MKGDAYTEGTDALREVMRRRNAESAPSRLSGNFEDKVMASIRKDGRQVTYRSRWWGIAASLIAAGLSMFLLWNHDAGKRIGQADDTGYPAPSKVDDYIDKLAAYYSIPSYNLDSDADTTNTSSMMYVFPDNDEIDLFGRLLMVAVNYDDDMPGYRLNREQQQLRFELQDSRKGIKYLWLAERINRQILLYCTHSPIGHPVPVAGYLEFYKEFTQTINKLVL